jgi:hypothetical protein
VPLPILAQGDMLVASIQAAITDRGLPERHDDLSNLGVARYQRAVS